MRTQDGYPWMRQKPLLGAGLDRSHPLAAKLAGAFLFNEGGGSPANLLSGQKQDSSAGVWASAPLGGCLSAPWSGTLAQIGGWNFTAAPWTVLAIAEVTGTQTATDTGSVLKSGVYTSESVNSGWLLGSSNAGLNWRYTIFNNAAAASYNLAGTTTRTIGTWLLAMTTDGTTRRGYCGLLSSGGKVVLDASSSAVSVSAATSTAGLATVNNAAFKSALYAAYGWNRALSLAEIQAVASEPYAFVEPMVPASWFVLSGGAAYTLAASTGVFALTGAVARLVLGQTLAAAPGTFAITGAPAKLALGRVLACSPGAFSLTGASAKLVLGRKLAASPGSFALTGSAAKLVLGRKLSASPGSFVVTGSPASLAYVGGAYTLAASTGVFALTGAVARLVLGRKLSAPPGAFTLSGAAAKLVLGRVLACVRGVFTLTGFPASLARSGAPPTAPVRVVRVPLSLDNVLRVPLSLDNVLRVPLGYPMSATGFCKCFVGEDVTVQGTDPTGRDMAGETIVLEIWNENETALLLTRPATPNSPAVGSASGTLASADTATVGAGVYAYKIRRTNSGSKNVLGDGYLTLLG